MSSQRPAARRRRTCAARQRRPVLGVLSPLVLIALVLVALAALTVLVPAPAVGQEADPFADCRQQIASDPAAYSGYRCLWMRATEPHLVELADAELQRHEPGAPEAWPTLVRGHLAFGDPPRALALYAEASERFAASAHPEADLGRVIALTNRRLLLRAAGRGDEARRVVEEARTVAERSGHAEARIRASLIEAQHQLDDVSALAPALRAVLRAEQAAFPDGPVLLRRWVLDLLATISFRLERTEDARDAYQRWRLLAQNEELLHDLPTIEYNLVNLELTELEQRPDQQARVDLIERAERGLAQALEQQDLRIAVYFHRTLAELWRNLDQQRAAAHADACVELAERQPQELSAQCRWTRALLLRREAPHEALELAENTLRVAQREADPTAEMWAARAVVHVVFDALDEAPAASGALEALSILESVQRQQQGLLRAEMAGVWLEEALYVVGRLVDDGQLQAAFDLAEQRRAQVLVEQLEASGRSRAQLSPALEDLEARIVGVQRRLLDPSLDAASRQRLHADLAQLELEEAELRSALESAAAPDARASSLAEIQASLAPGEALLSFVVGLRRDLYGDPSSGSWVFYLTRDSFGVEPIPERTELEPAVRLYRGMFRRGATWSPAIAAALRRRLLDPVLSRLPSGVDTLLVAADGVLHGLPIDTLLLPEADGGGPFRRLALVPSATIWSRLRQQGEPDTGAGPGAGSVLLVGSPEQADGASSPQAGADAGLFALAANVPRLPWARRELRESRSTLGRGAVLSGVEASEARLSRALLDGERVELLHLAAHAIVDEREPARSSVVLAAGSEDEDGLLQSREIAALPLAGSLVVLSACDTAAGRQLRGEGVLSLARSFFRAGSRTVLATRWPLRDDHARELIAAFYRSAARGEPVAEALAEAQREARQRGLPSEAWGGFVLLGDPTLRLAPRTEPGLPGPVALMVALGGLAAVAVLVGVGRRRGWGLGVRGWGSGDEGKGKREK
ncbi:MAG: CHAT domain-containing protein [Acidobacteria bacterium]|nr:MAG: CHAT domain-containing protein [Acidobacteriota bacterium]